ncbi:TatD family hydrolase [Candidatus Woesearchaeota archaeon]|nr:TatD family hydrolase [Candidatus Woesearchaeota archaeon]
MLVDVHAHLNHKAFENKLDQVIERAEKKGVKSIICSGINTPTNKEVLELSKKYKIIHASAGIYPIDALGDQKPPEDEGLTYNKGPINLEKEFKFIKENKKNFIAIGEVGLDQLEKIHLEEQKKIFQQIIEFSKEIKKPLVIHSRKAEKECIELLEKNNCKKVNLHCFTGKLKLAKKAEELGFYFSIPAICVRLQHFQEIIRRTNINNLLTETDAPYLTPEIGRSSEPKDVLETIRIISKIKNLDLEETKKIIFKNYQDLFLK